MSKQLKIFLLFLVILGFTSCNRESEFNFTINGKFDSILTSDIYAIREISLDSLQIDTIKVNNGVFGLKGKVNSPTAFTLFYKDSLPPIRFYVDEGYQVNVKADGLHPISVEIKGGEINEDLSLFRKKNENLLLAKERAFAKKGNFDPAEMKNIDFQLAGSVRDYVTQNPTKIASVVLMDQYSIGNISPELLSHDIEILKGHAAEFYLTTRLKDYIKSAMGSAVGSHAPEIALITTKGKDFKLRDHKGKHVLLIFDLKDSPANETYFLNLKESYKKVRKNVEFVSIVIDEDPRKPDPTVLKIANSLDWIVLIDSQKWNSKEVKKYNVTTAPYMILISPDGIIKERNVSLDSLVINYGSPIVQ